MRNIAVDVECYRNYFLVGCLDMKTGESRCFDFRGDDAVISRDDHAELKRIMLCPGHEIVTFNGLAYDILMIEACLSGWPCHKLKKLSDALIVKKQRAWNLRKRANIQKLSINHVDLFWVTPYIGSLKNYGARIHTKTIQDLPYEPNAKIKKKQVKTLHVYVINDCTITAELFGVLKREIDLRRMLGTQEDIDLRSKSDAQVGEAILMKRLRMKRQKVEPKMWELYYEQAAGVEFKSKQLKQLQDDVMLTPFYVNGAGFLSLSPDFIADTITIGNRKYKFGVGGLHSMEKRQSVYADKAYNMEYLDVSSFYPRIIINERLATTGTDRKAFTKVYKSIVTRRMEAKRAGDKNVADSLKITINGCFGKFGNIYSPLYTPQMVMQITVTGQLFLLMLIEMLTTAGADVVSANTDGIVIHYPKRLKDKIAKTRADWERKTRMSLDVDQIRSLHSRDVNTYIMIVDKHKTKRMGTWAEQRSVWHRLRKNPHAEIAVIAAERYIRYKRPLMHTIKQHKDIRDFVVVQNVRNGAMKNGRYLGVTIRWIYSRNEKGNITRRDNGNQVPKSVGAHPVMTLPKKIPNDIDYDWYFTAAQKVLYDAGIPYTHKDQQRRLV